MRVMLFEKNEHGFIKDTDVSQASFFRALSFVMYNRSRQEVIGVSCKDEPIGEIDVFAVHEKTFVELPGRPTAIPDQKLHMFLHRRVASQKIEQHIEIPISEQARRNLHCTG